MQLLRRGRVTRGVVEEAESIEVEDATVLRGEAPTWARPGDRGLVEKAKSIEGDNATVLRGPGTDFGAAA